MHHCHFVEVHHLFDVICSLDNLDVVFLQNILSFNRGITDVALKDQRISSQRVMASALMLLYYKNF